MNIEIYKFDDWANIVINGKCWYSGHSIGSSEFSDFLTEVLGLQITDRYVSMGEDGCDPLMDAYTKEPLPELEARYPFLGTHPDEHERWKRE